MNDKTFEEDHRPAGLAVDSAALLDFSLLGYVSKGRGGGGEASNKKRKERI